MTECSRRRLLRGSLALASISLLAGCGVLPSQSQQAATVPRIGYLVIGRSGPNAQDEAFRQGLAELGYVEGENLAIEWRFTERSEPLPDLAAELVGLPVELIVAAGSPAVDAAKSVTATTPIVMPVSGDPVAQGYVASLARPGGNVTGLTTLSSTPLAGKRLQLLRETVPAISQVAVLWNPGNTAKVIDFKETQVAAEALGLTLLSLEVRGPDDFDRAFDAAAAGHVDGLDALSDLFLLPHAKRIADFALTSRLPSIFENRSYAEAGGMMVYGPNAVDLFRRAATYVDRILKGAQPAELPVEQPTTFELVINLQTARALGLTIPQEALMQATEIIQ